ncbi:hypothetical protein B0O99DRAFT_41432 [Bisporella sp. PMI_857]|nr:hypothetical protein B0O99DRAFT_41432 [Bisporella sp. PMI_857]
MPPQSSSTLLVVAQPAAKVPWQVMPQCRWEEPQLSVGVPRASLDILGRYKCWSLKDKSPAHLVWKTASKAINSLLEDRFEHLGAGGSDLMVEMFMIGRKPASSSPTILFSCESKTCRQNAMGLVQKKGILADHPGVLMAECSRLPKPLALDKEPDLPLLPPGVYLNGPLRSFGTSVLIYTEEGKLPRKSTIGGFITIGHELFGVTAAHVFFPAMEEDSSDDKDLEFAFFGDEPYDSQDDEEELVELTSQASMSSGSSQSPGMDESEYNFQGSVTSSSDSTFNERIQPARHTAVIDIDGKKTAVKLGELFVSTETGKSLDWALVKIRASSSTPQATHLLHQSNIMWAEKLIYPSCIENATSDVKVLILTGLDGIVEGTLSAVTSFTINSKAHTFQSLLTVRRLVGKFSDGDCGSWVFDMETGDVYGHVVSGYPGTETAYIVPSLQIFQDIQHRVGKPVELFAHAANKARDNISEYPGSTIRGTVVHDFDALRPGRSTAYTYIHANEFTGEPSNPYESGGTELPAPQVSAEAPVVSRGSASRKKQQPRPAMHYTKPEIPRHDTRSRSSIASNRSSDSGYASSLHSTSSFVSIPSIQEDEVEWERGGNEGRLRRGKRPPSAHRDRLFPKLQVPGTVNTDDALCYGIPTSLSTGNQMRQPVPLRPRAVTTQRYPARPLSYHASLTTGGYGPPLSASTWFNYQSTPASGNAYPPPITSDYFASPIVAPSYPPPSYYVDNSLAAKGGTSNPDRRPEASLASRFEDVIARPSAPSGFREIPDLGYSFSEEADQDGGYASAPEGSTPMRSRTPPSPILSNSVADDAAIPHPPRNVIRRRPAIAPEKSQGEQPAIPLRRPGILRRPATDYPDYFGAPGEYSEEGHTLAGGEERPRHPSAHRNSVSYDLNTVGQERVANNDRKRQSSDSVPTPTP